MKKSKVKIYLLALFMVLSISANSQNSVLIVYWHNWNDSGAPYVMLDQIDSRYNVICIAFAEPTSPSDMTMHFTPDVVSQSTLITQVQTLQAQGTNVLISIGGANASILLNNTANRDAFINSMTAILNTFHFDGIDIDIEHGSSVLAS